MKKFELTDNVRKIRIVDSYGARNHRVKQVKALIDFGNVKAGDLGGWIEEESFLSQEGLCWVGGNAIVVGRGSLIDGDSIVDGNVNVVESKIHGTSRVTDDTFIWLSYLTNVEVTDKAQVLSSCIAKDCKFADTSIAFSAKIEGTTCTGDSRIFKGTVKNCIFDNARSHWTDIDGKEIHDDYDTYIDDSAFRFYEGFSAAEKKKLYLYRDVK